MTLSSPSPLVSFGGQTFDSDTALNGVSTVPPDPSIAVSAQYVITASNGSIAWFTRDGTLLHSQSLDSLMSAGATITGTFDPKIVYDAAANRFVIAATNGLEMFIAVSNTGDPSQGWTVGMASADGAAQGNLIDFASLATNGRSIFVTANVFDAAGALELGSQIFVWQ